MVVHREPSQPNPDHDEAAVVRSARPLGVKNADILYDWLTNKEMFMDIDKNHAIKLISLKKMKVSAVFINNSELLVSWLDRK